MKHQEIDFLLIGQGLAGSLLAYQLLERGAKIQLIDHEQPYTSSKVAAGLYNPITGKQMHKTWLADALFDYLPPFYKALEKKVDAHFLIEKAIYRPFLTIEEQNDWMGRSSSNQLQAYLKEIKTESIDSENIHDPLGGLVLNRCGYVKVETMIAACKRYFINLDAYLSEVFDERALIFEADHVIYKQFKAQTIVYCGGAADAQSKFWNWVPFRPVKGEVLKVKLPFEFDSVLNRGVFILPAENGICKIGSTYNWKNLTTEITEEAKIEMLEKTTHLIKHLPEVVGQIAGVRPATSDRRPVMGRHPKQASLAIFNGLGTKGVSLAPYFSAMMADFLLGKHGLLPEVNLERFFSLYSKSDF